MTLEKSTKDFDLLDQTGDQEYDKQFFQAHRQISFKSSLYFAMASASFFGVLSSLTNMLVRSVEEDQPLFKSKKTPLVIGGLMSMGSVFAFWSNTQQTKLRQLEDNRLARRINSRGVDATPAQEELLVQDNDPAPSRQWQERVAKSAAPERSR